MSPAAYFRKLSPQVRMVLVLSLCAAGMLLGMGAFAFHSAKGTSYLSNDPKACVNCHIMNEQYDSWEKSSHHAIATCNDCHVPHDFVGKWIAKAEHGWNHSKAFTTGDFHDPIQVKPKSARDLQNNCLRCHGDLTSDISGHKTTADHEPMNCVRCHSNVGHGARGSF